MATSNLVSAQSQPERSATDYLIAAKQIEIQNLAYFLQMGQLVVMISDLVHALQKERGASNIFLGSKGRHFEQSLSTLTQQTDQQIQDFKHTLNQIHPELSQHCSSSRLLNRIAYVLHGLAGLLTARQKIRQLALATELSTQLYSDIISGLLAIVFETADSAVDPTIARILVAMFNLMHGKELAGQERALGSAGFAAGQFSATQIERLQYLIDAQERCFELFREFAHSAAQQLWQQQASQSYLIEIERLRRLILTQTQQHNRALPADQDDQWFALLTQRIDDLKSVETALEVHLQQLCEQKLSDAQTALGQQQALIEQLQHDKHDNSDSFVVFLSSQDPQLKTAQHDHVHPDGLSPRLGRSVFELVQHQAHRLQQMQDELDAARQALEERKLQQKAKALLIKHRQMSEDEAHRLLRQMAMDQGKKLSDVAKTIIEMAQVWR